jgi:hypothetical protein
VEFYQKRYHNFPLKHTQLMRYVFINAEEERPESTPAKLIASADDPKSLMKS